MRVWRICRRPFADLLGEGARIYGGRWNEPGYPLVYTAETAALAVLEVRVHLDLPWTLLPTDYVLMEVETGAASIEEAGEVADKQSFGTRWLTDARSTLLIVPSAIVAESRNVLINPAHVDASMLTITSIRTFAFDERLWLPKI